MVHITHSYISGFEVEVSMKKNYKIYIIIIFIILAIPGVLALIPPQRDYSANENRYLDKFPKASASEILSGKFQDKFATAFDDQFFIRDKMTGLSTSFKKLLGFKDAGGVYIADDNYYITKITDSDISQERFIQNLRYVSYFAKKQDSNVYTMLVPSTGTILKDKLPAFAPFYNTDSIYSTASTLLGEPGFIDIRKTLEEQPEDVFFKTDHHWTLNGAYAAYCEYCKNVKPGLNCHSYELFNPVKVDNNFYGTLYSKALDPAAKPDKLYAIQTEETANARVTNDNDKLHTGIYDKESLDKKDKYAYFFGGNYGRTDIRTSSTGLKLLVIKDSFANSFVPFLLGDYSHITMIDLRYYNEPVFKTVLKEKYDHILILYEISNFAQDKNLYKLTK